MAILESCYEFLAGRRDQHRPLRHALNHLFSETLKCSRLEVWSLVYNNRSEEELFTNILIASNGIIQTKSSSETHTRSAILQRLIDSYIIDLSIDLPYHIRDITQFKIIVALPNSFRLNADDTATMKAAVVRLYQDSISYSINHVNDRILDITQTSKDLTSFLYKAIHFVLIPVFKFSAASMFYYERKTDSIILGASTGLQRQEKLNIKRSDIRYFADGTSSTAKCYRDGKEIIEHLYQGRPPDISTNGEIEQTVYSRLYAPLRRWDRIVHDPVDIRSADVSARDMYIHSVTGVLRGLNINSDNGYHPMTVIEALRLRCFCSTVSVMIERYVKTLSILHDQERATHGYNTDLATIKHAVQNIELWFQRVETQASAAKSSATAIQEIRYRIRDILAVQDNMSSQILTVMHYSGGSKLADRASDMSECDKPFIDIIMRLVTAKRGMSECYGRRELELRFNGNRKPEEAFIRMPALAIPIGSLYLVFRNIAENAIKYSQKGVGPILDISWACDGTNIEFHFMDNGIGIPSEEQPFIFREGFRGQRAQEMQLRGNGLGLAVSRDMLSKFGGTMTYSPRQNAAGSIFIIRIPVKKEGGE